MTLVDTNVVIDVLTADPVWLDWSVGVLERAREDGDPGINAVTYAELAARYDAEDQLEADLGLLRLRLLRGSQAALFLAGQAFARHRAAGGPRTSLLADFFIGVHAEAEGLPVLTRDPRRYRSYFPAVRLITP